MFVTVSCTYQCGLDISKSNDKGLGYKASDDDFKYTYVTFHACIIELDALQLPTVNNYACDNRVGLRVSVKTSSLR